MTGAQIAIAQGATFVVAQPREDLWVTARTHGACEVVADVATLAGRDLDVVIDFAGFGSTTTGATVAGVPEHLEAVLDLMSDGRVTVKAEKISFTDIADGLGRLRRGEVNGRLVTRLDS